VKTYCLNISFPNTEFSSIKYHGHLLIKEEEIELKIFYESGKSDWRTLSDWTRTINWNDFGNYLSVEYIDDDENVQKIDLFDAKLLKFTTESNQNEGNHSYILLLIDYVKLYSKSDGENNNVGDFYFNDAGFHVVKDLYYPLSEEDSKFTIRLRKESEDIHTFKFGSFKFEFHFWKKDRGDFREAKIIKEPRVRFTYEEGISEKEIFYYSEVVALLASFYFGLKVDYIFSSVTFNNQTVTIKKVGNNTLTERAGNLWAFRYYFDFTHFLKCSWEANLSKDFKKFKKSVDMYLQSMVVDSNSRFLIRYNILEILMGGEKKLDNKFELALDKETVKAKYEEALKILLDTIKPDDYNEFRKKWLGVPSKLSYRPMKSPLLTFLQGQGLKPDEFQINVDRLKEMRDSITHGSIDTINSRELHRANVLLYRISGVILMNLLGAKPWVFDNELPN